MDYLILYSHSTLGTVVPEKMQRTLNRAVLPLTQDPPEDAQEPLPLFEKPPLAVEEVWQYEYTLVRSEIPLLVERAREVYRLTYIWERHWNSSQM